MRIAFFALLLFPILIFSCKSEPKKTLTDKDYRIFAERLDSTLSNSKSELLRSSCDADRLLERSMKTLDLNFIAEGQFKTGFMSKFDEFCSEIANTIGEGEFTFMRMEKTAEGQTALFRVYSGGFNYLRFIFDEKDGKPIVTDIYFFSTAEHLSEMLAVLASSFAKKDGGITNEKNVEKQVDLMEKLKISSANSDCAGAEEAYKKMPPKMQKAKSILLMRLQACGEDDEQFQVNAKEYQRLYPNDPSLSLIMIDPYVKQQKYAECLKCIDDIDKNVKDPALDFYRANLYFAMDSIALANTLFKKLSATEKGLLGSDARKSYVNLLIYESNYDEALAFCKELTEKHGYTKKQVEEEVIGEQYLFLMLEEVQTWLKS